MTLSDTILALARDVAAPSANRWFKEAAQATGLLPVYADVGGTLLLSPDLTVFIYDDETGTTTECEDPQWRTVALVRAAQRHPELASLMPVRPPEAVDCTTCDGGGVLLKEVVSKGVLCGVCNGTGWIANGL